MPELRKERGDKGRPEGRLAHGHGPQWRQAERPAGQLRHRQPGCLVTASRRLALTSALVAAEILTGCTPVASRMEAPHVAPEVRAAVRAGRAHVLVELRISGLVGPTTDAIAAVQEHVLVRLADTDHRV